MALAIGIVVALSRDDGGGTTAAPTTTTTVPPLFEDRFEGASSLVLVTGPSDTGFEVTPDGRGRITALGGATCLLLYPETDGDVEVSFSVGSDSWGTGTRFGAWVFSDAVSHYVSVVLNPAFQTVDIASYSTGGFLDGNETAIPRRRDTTPAE